MLNSLEVEVVPHLNRPMMGRDGHHRLSRKYKPLWVLVSR